MKAALISIRPKWCEKIVNGKKTIEVRKTRPKLETPFKCYIYCTKDTKKQFWTGPRYSYVDDHSHNPFDKCGSGKVIGEFLCNLIIEDRTFGHNERLYRAACMSACDAAAYAVQSPMYGWHIANVKIYDKPRKLNAFYKKCSEYTELGTNCFDCKYECGTGEVECASEGRLRLHRAPQSWCYVEEQQ